MVSDATKKIILAGLGTIDEQNEEIKDLLRRGSEIMGLGNVDNEELLYDGNREEIMQKRKEAEKANNTLELGHGRSIYYNSVKDEDGKTIERNIEYEKKSEYGTREVSFEAQKDADGTKSVSFGKKINEDNPEAKGGADNDQN